MVRTFTKVGSAVALVTTLFGVAVRPPAGLARTCRGTGRSEPGDFAH